jgi:hypothetical protein
MSFIALPINDIDDIQEDKIVPEGTYKLVISDVKERNNDSGELKGLLVICEIQGMDDVANVLHNISIPTASDDSDKLKNKLKFIARFVQLFKIPVKGNQLDPQVFIGKTADCMLVQDSYNDTVSNKIKLPNIK